MNNRGFDYFALTVAIIGAINWGLIGFFKFDLVAFLFGDLTVLSRIVYAIVGICGLYLISVYGRITSFNEACDSAVYTSSRGKTCGLIIMHCYEALLICSFL